MLLTLCLNFRLAPPKERRAVNFKQTKDYELIERLDTRAFPDDYRLWYPLHRFWIIYDEGEVIGYCSTREYLDCLFFSRMASFKSGIGVQRTAIRKRLAWARRNGHNVVHHLLCAGQLEIACQFNKSRVYIVHTKLQVWRQASLLSKESIKMKDVSELTDAELAEALFKRLKAHGFKVEEDLNAYAGCEAKCFELFSDRDEPFCNFDFHSDGQFYRIAGYTQGFWQDEVDWKKYGYGEKKVLK